MKHQGLGVKIAVNDEGEAYGMIQYVPIEFSTVKGEDLYFVDCIWVHGYKEGVGNLQKTGTGIALLKAAEEDVQSRGAKGLVVWGLAIPFWMKASWYKKVDKNGIAVLLWKPFAEDAKSPKCYKEVKRPQAKANPNKVTVFVFYHSKCQVPVIALERVKRAVATFGDQVLFFKESIFFINILFSSDIF